MLVFPARAKVALIALFAALVVAGCATPRTGDTYTRGEALRVQSVELGVIESLRPVRIEGAPSGVGTMGGAALGGIAGSTLGSGAELRPGDRVRVSSDGYTTRVSR
jgi:outer membrane lipoprotein SlyB